MSRKAAFHVSAFFFRGVEYRSYKFKNKLFSSIATKPLHNVVHIASKIARDVKHVEAKHVERLLKSVVAVDAEQCGLTSEYYARHKCSNNERDNFVPIIHYIDIVDTLSLSIGIFILPQGAHIPLHDHPDMHVVTRVLSGKLNINSYDFVDSIDKDFSTRCRCHGTGGMAKHRESLLLDPLHAPTDLLYPNKGNIHELTALSHAEPCAMLNVALPSYSAAHGRSCTYYSTSTKECQTTDSNIVMLETTSEPLHLMMTSSPYEGLLPLTSLKSI